MGPCGSVRDNERSFLLWVGQSVTSMAAQILGHTQQGVQGMLCTERRAMLLPLVIYMDGELFESRHVLENEVATVS
jgi:hypothetical protein